MNMERIIATMFCVMLAASCSKRDGYFGEMPSSYDASGLDHYGEVINNIRTRTVLDGDGLEVSCRDCEYMIHFCGLLEFRNDTIFFSNNVDKKRKILFVLGEKKNSK